MGQSRDNDKKNPNPQSLKPSETAPKLPTSAPDPTNVIKLGLIKSNKNAIINNNLFSPPLPSQPPIAKKIIVTVSQSNSVGSCEKYFNDLNSAISALLPNYEILRKGKLSIRTHSLKKLNQIVDGFRNEMMKKIKSISNQPQQVDILYSKGIADLLITLHKYLSDRIQGKTGLIDELNKSDNQNDHHAFRMVALLFKKAYAGMPNNILSAIDTVLSNDVNKEKNMAMVHVKYLATTVLCNLSDADAKDNNAYKQVLDKLPAPVFVEAKASSNYVVHTSQPGNMESGKPSRANRSAHFSHPARPNSGAEGATQIDEKKPTQGKPSRHR
jgi:hypothetical protein